MVLTNYPSDINNKFFAFSSKPKDNVQLTEFISGRVVGYQKNSKKLLSISCSIRFDKTELQKFWTWFNDELGQTAGAFYCSALGSAMYRFTSVPEPQDTNLKYRTLNLEIEEV